MPTSATRSGTSSGHSWGTILGLEYYRAHPDRVASLTLASAAIDIPTWEKNVRRMLTTLSDSAQRAIKTREAEGKFAAPDYQAANGEFMGKYVVRTPPGPDLDSTFTTYNEAIYNYMQGPSEFTITGTLKTYNAKPVPPRVRCPCSSPSANSTKLTHPRSGNSPPSRRARASQLSPAPPNHELG